MTSIDLPKGASAALLHSPFLLSSTAEPKLSAPLGGTVITWDRACSVYSIPLRPDVKEDSLLSLFEQLSLSLGSAVKKLARAEKVENKAENVVLFGPCLLATCSSEGKAWSALRIHMGADLTYQRVAIVVINPSAAAQSKYFASSSSTTQFQDFCAHTLQLLCEGLEAQKWAYKQLLSAETSLCNELAEGVLDLSHVLDMLSVAPQHMTLLLAEEVDKVDGLVRTVELKTAKLMTLLRPAYQRAGLTMPVPPAGRGLGSYPLTLLRPSLRDSCSLDQAKMMLLLARKAYRDLLKNPSIPSFSSSSIPSPLSSLSSLLSPSAPDLTSQSYQVHFLLQHITEQLESWREEEQKIRLERKGRAVKDRLQDLSRLTADILKRLHSRFSSSPATTLSSSFFTMLGGGGDRKYQQGVAQLFPFLQEREGVLHDAPALCLSSEGTAKGQLYVTVGHVLFAGGGGLLGGEGVVKVLPCKTISLLQLISAGRILSSIGDADSRSIPRSSSGFLDPNSPPLPTPTASSPAQTPSLHLDLGAEPPSASSRPEIGEGIVIVNKGGNEVTFVLSDLTPHMHERVFDMISFIWQEKMFLLIESTNRNHSSNGASSSNTSSSNTSGSNKVDERSLPMPTPPKSSSSKASGKTTVEKAEADQNKMVGMGYRDPVLERLEADMQMNELIQEIQRIEHLDDMMEVITFQPITPQREDNKETITSPPSASITLGETKDNGVTAENRDSEEKPKRKNLGASIQKFLQQSQQQKSKTTTPS